jgi:hypothetical protein
MDPIRHLCRNGGKKNKMKRATHSNRLRHDTSRDGAENGGATYEAVSCVNKKWMRFIEEARNRMGRMGRMGRMVFAGDLDRNEWMHVDEEDMSRMGRVVLALDAHPVRRRRSSPSCSCLPSPS